GKQQCEDSTDQSKRNIQQYEQRTFHGVEGIKKQNKNEKHTERDHQTEPQHCALLIFKLAAPGDEVTRLESYLGLHPLLHICNYAAHVSAAVKNRNAGHSHAGLPADIKTTALNTNLGDLVQSNAQSPGSVNQDVPDGAYAIARVVAYSRRYLEAFFTFPNFGRRFTSDGGLDDILNVGNV